MDLRQSAANWLAGMLAANASAPITYTSGEYTVTLQATISSSRLKVSSPGGAVQVVRTDADFIFQASALIQGGQVAEPRRGDTIAMDYPDGITRYYVVLPYGGDEPIFRYSDPNRTIIRVHAKFRL
jgi:hypothetical protein